MMGIETAAQGSAALWELYSTTDFLQKEYDQFHVLLLHTNCDSPISTKGKVINSIADIKGMGIRANSGPPTEFVKRLGATPVSIVIGELYSSIEKGVLDAVITDWHALYSFKLYEQINNYLNEHIHVSPYFLLMNKDVYNSLSDNQKKALDDNSGTAALELAGDTWDEMTKMVGDIIAEKGYNLYELPPAEHDKMRAIAEQTWADWVTARTAEGYDAQAVLDKAVELVAKNK
jgi:TRAP-type C4-dicarboxylate transport system substrate-binding protein